MVISIIMGISGSDSYFFIREIRVHPWLIKESGKDIREKMSEPLIAMM